MKVLCTAKNFLLNDEPVKLLANAGIQIKQTRYGGSADEKEIGEQEMIDLLADIDAIICITARISKKAIESSCHLKVISMRGVGYDGIDLDACAARGIKVTITAGAVDDGVADFTMALLLALARGITKADCAVRAGQWLPRIGTEIRGKTLGLIGFGRIGKAVARRAVGGFDMRVVAFDAVKDTEFAAKWGVEYVTLETLLRSSDFVSIHAPLTPETRGLIGADEIDLMKPTAFLINTARGSMVDESALYDALREQKIAGAGFDVFVNEPLQSSPLGELDNTILTPHMAGFTREGLIRANMWAAQNVIDVLAGRELCKGVLVV